MTSKHLVVFCLLFVSITLAAVLQKEETSVAIPPRPESVGFVDEGDHDRIRRQYGGYYYPAYYPTYTYYPYSSYGVVGNSYNMAGFYPHYNPIGTGSAWAAGGGLVGNTLSFIIG